MGITYMLSKWIKMFGKWVASCSIQNMNFILKYGFKKIKQRYSFSCYFESVAI